MKNSPVDLHNLELDLDPGLTVSREDLLVDGSDAEFRAMVHDLLAFAARLEQIRARFGRFIGLSGVQYTILITIRQLQGENGVGAKAIAEHLAFSPPFVTTETTRLVRLGLVAKRPNPEDLRRVYLTVTDKGIALLTELAPVQQEINDLLFEPVTGDTFEMVRRMARDLRASSERAALLSEYLTDAGKEER
ncbi:MarR family winged helix-turn-helix transcriptional regulator [Pseudohoeflea coraliihabitans]|uniref:MarR family transcriptional regulator n=1 Tax=Pseudohoeflea coraliihabitans TaxID=2860393 RepID=A0ABS6WQB5_9HYPH|nr:MarR family transcriptional regulator [Pseudohoeflea sp. DP4N28-3]MBW3098167.1 MarR family transcriptional regulator [Pseudohoeflea sp. DP4N28-3]